uniref:Uncharacterized protein n=1 Tax=Caenorhabditis japonica TaxID=281687 RepID=A0A2Q4SH64_CAEJA
MKVSAAFAEIVSEFSGFQHLHPSPSTSSLSSSSSSTPSVQRYSLNIAVGVQPICRTDSLNSFNDFQGAQRKNSAASSVIVIE